MTLVKGVRTEQRKLINDTLLKSEWMTDTYKKLPKEYGSEWASKMAEEIQEQRENDASGKNRLYFNCMKYADQILIVFSSSKQCHQT